MKEIQLAHGGGGEEMNELLQRLFSLFDNGILKEANDAAFSVFFPDLKESGESIQSMVDFFRKY